MEPKLGQSTASIQIQDGPDLSTEPAWERGDIFKRQMGGGLFPGMTALVGEAGPELLSIGNSFGEVMNSKDTQNKI